jgi:hypothetical protein
MRTYPAIQNLIFQLLTVGSNPSYQSLWGESRRLIELDVYIQMLTKQQTTIDVIANFQNTTSGRLLGTIVKAGSEEEQKNKFEFIDTRLIHQFMFDYYLLDSRLASMKVRRTIRGSENH